MAVSSYFFKFHQMPNKRVLARIDLAQNMEYIVNFIEIAEAQYEVFFYPSINTLYNLNANGKAKLDIAQLNKPEVQLRLWFTMREVIQSFADTYSPEVISLTTQFNAQLQRIQNGYIIGYETETIKNKVYLTKRKT